MGSEAPLGALQRPSAPCGAVEWDARARTPRSGPRPFQGPLSWLRGSPRAGERPTFVSERLAPIAIRQTSRIVR